MNVKLTRFYISIDIKEIPRHLQQIHYRQSCFQELPLLFVVVAMTFLVLLLLLLLFWVGMSMIFVLCACLTRFVYCTALNHVERIVCIHCERQIRLNIINSIQQSLHQCCLHITLYVTLIRGNLTLEIPLLFIV